VTHQKPSVFTDTHAFYLLVIIVLLVKAIVSYVFLIIDIFQLCFN